MPRLGPAWYQHPVRVLVARCAVDYTGRLGARLPPALRLVVLKADGSIAVHADAKAYKPLNWMNPPCAIVEADGVITATNPQGERLVVELHDVLFDDVFELGDDPGLAKDGVEAELQLLLAARVDVLGNGLRLVRREYPTDVGPVDLLCRDGDGRAAAARHARARAPPRRAPSRARSRSGRSRTRCSRARPAPARAGTRRR